MAFISLTRLRIASRVTYPWAVVRSLVTAIQAARSDGFIDGDLLRDGPLTLWTRTAWRDEVAMKAYRDSGPHLRLMPKLIRWCDEAAVAHWLQRDDTLPTWTEAHARMAASGRPSRVAKPSLDHQARRVGPMIADPERYEVRLAPFRPGAR